MIVSLFTCDPLHRGSRVGEPAWWSRTECAQFLIGLNSADLNLLGELSVTLSLTVVAIVLRVRVEAVRPSSIPDHRGPAGGCPCGPAGGCPAGLAGRCAECRGGDVNH